MKKATLKMSKKTGLLFLIFFLISLYVPAQNSSDKLAFKVDSLANSAIKNQNIPGLSVVVVKYGKIEYVKGYGFANLEHRVPVKPETIFQAGSIGKQFTAFAIMLLVEGGKLSLDDRLTQFFPDAPYSWDSVTIRNLLTHTAGFEQQVGIFKLENHFKHSKYEKVVSK